MKSLFQRQTILYLLFGILTTLVNYVVFHLLYTLVLGMRGSLFSNFIAWIAAVIFAFVVNKCYVFESKSWAWAVLRREIPAFVTGRVASFAMEEAGLFISEQLLQLNEVTVFTFRTFRLDGVTASKLALSVLVVVLNYFFSKWFVFRPKAKGGDSHGA